jgi:hypothetical protein
MKLEIVEREGFYGIRKKVWGIFYVYRLLYVREWSPFVDIGASRMEVDEEIERLCKKPNGIKVVTHYET